MKGNVEILKRRKKGQPKEDHKEAKECRQTSKSNVEGYMAITTKDNEAREEGSR